MTGIPLLSEKKVLVIDDMSSMRQMVRACLMQIGLPEPAEATNGKVALAFLQARDFDLVVCDLDMPVMDGLALLKAVRADSRLKRIKFLMLTANAQGRIVREAVAAGVDDYIVKPFQPQTLQAKAERLLTRRLADWAVVQDQP